VKSKFTTRELASIWGLHERSVQRILAGCQAPFKMEAGRRIYYFADQSPEIQKLFLKQPISSQAGSPLSAHNGLVPVSSQLESACNPYSRGLSEDLLKDSNVQRCVAIVRQALDVPADWKPKAWKEQVALRHGIRVSTVYKYIARQEARGISAHRHTKANKGQPKIWDMAALEFGVGLALKRQHRKLSQKAVYRAVRDEAALRGWAVGGYRSFCIHLSKKLNPLLVKLRDGGRRGLDNALPPILRTYKDLQPNERWVGDQHRFDHVVRCDVTGTLFRPEGYFFQDLRTRQITGFWLGRHYNAHAIGSALRLGCRTYGAPKGLYCDNGKPETSNYIRNITNEIATLDMSFGETVDFPVNLEGQDAEEAAGALNRGLIFAIIKNAKAKMVESTFRHLMAIIRDVFKVPGHVKKLSACGEEQEIDQLEMEKLAKSGQLLTFTEFLLVLIQAIDFYNRERSHRGVHSEWAWEPKPPTVTPYQCLMACYEEGWRPTKISDEELDLLFLFRATRSVDRGRIRFRTARADLYEDVKLADLKEGEKVSIRFDPLDPSYLLVYVEEKFFCRATPVEFSSMKDMTLAEGKIEEKRRLAKAYITEYHRLTSQVPDLTQYSNIPVLENTAKAVQKQIREEKLETERLSMEPTAEQLKADIRQMETFEANSEETPIIKVRQPRRQAFFECEEDKAQYLMDLIKQGNDLPDTDLKWLQKFKADAIQRDCGDYWAMYEQTNEISEQVATQLRRVS